MKGVIKCLIAGGIIAAIGIAIIVIALSVNGKTAKAIKFEMQSYVCTTANTVLDIELGAGTVKTEYYEGETISIEYPSSSKYTTEVKENNGTFYFKSQPKWWLFFGSVSIPDTVIKIPNGAKLSLDIDIGAGKIELADGAYSTVDFDISAGSLSANYIECDTLEFDISAGSAKFSDIKCNSLKCDISAGSLSMNKIDCPKSEIHVSAGSLKAGYKGEKSEYGISVKKSAGSCNVGSQSGNTDKTIRANISAGSVNLTFGA